MTYASSKTWSAWHAREVAVAADIWQRTVTDIYGDDEWTDGVKTRADMCQDMLVAILAEEATRETVAADVKKFVSKVMQQSPWKYKWISFDAPINEDGNSLHDVMSNEEAAEQFVRSRL